MKRKGFYLLSLVIALSILLAACGGGAPATVVVTKIVGGETITEVITATPEIVPEPVVLNWNFGTEPPTADPSLATDTTSVDVITNIFMGLTRFDPETGQILPWLADSWEISEDGLVYTFHLRQDIPWVFYNTGTAGVELVYDEDGKQRFVNAYDIEYGAKRTIDPVTASNYAYVLYVIENAQAVNSAEEGVTLDDVGVKALDDWTVEFTLESPAGYFPAIAGMWVSRPMPQWVIEAAGDKWTEPGTIVTNGPYVMSEWVHGSSLTLKKNPLHPDADSVQIDEIFGVMIVNESIEFAMYEANELDTAGVPLPEMDRVKVDPILSKEYVNAPSICTYYYGFTNNKAPFDDVRVRKAFSMSVDKQSLVDNVTKGGQIPAGHFAVPGVIFGAPEVGSVGLPYDPIAAKALLQEYLDEKGLAAENLKIEFLFNTGEGHANIAASLQQMWKDNLGIEVKLSNMEWRVLLNHVQNSTPLAEMPHIFRQGWCADYPDENNWVYEVMHATASANELRRGCLDDVCEEVELQEFDLIIEQAKVESDPEVRVELYFQAEKILSEVEVAYLPLYFYTVNAVDKPYLTRYHDRLSGNNFWTWTLDWEAKKAALGQ